MSTFRGALVAAGLAALAAMPLHAQDRIQLGIKYSPGVQPGVIVVAGPGLDSVRKIVERDLQYSDRFQVAFWPDSAGPFTGTLNTQLYRETLGLTWAVELQPSVGGVHVRLHNLASGQVALDAVRGVITAGTGRDRLDIHRLSDEVTKLATGSVGIAASRILFHNADNAIWSIDSDGANLEKVSRGTGIAYSPNWSRDGGQFAYSEMRDYGAAIILQNLASFSRKVVPSTTGSGQAITPALSPDGKELLFGWSTDHGTDLYRVDVARMCCVMALTASGRLADNLSPTYSPDGRRVAFVSTRAGNAQIYVMDADGANQRALDLAAGPGTGNSYAPDWSPDGERVAFHRDIAGGRQVLFYDFGTGRATAITSAGRNEDPSWAPDSRHLVYKSDRSRGQQLWVIDTETGNFRQLTTLNGANTLMPDWSPSLTGTTP